MIKITKPLELKDQTKINEQILRSFSNNLNRIFFFDIETTGFSPKTSKCYLIGGIMKQKDQWCYIQWFAQNEEQETAILLAFTEFLANYDVLIHFNGDGFDLPFLAERCKRLGIPAFQEQIHAMESIDLFKITRKLRKLLNLENYKQKTIEHFLGIARDDTYSGGELIAFYQEYCKTQDSEKERLLLLHNHDDICGMPLLLPIISYQQITSNHYAYQDAILNTAKDYEGCELEELLITLKLAEPIPTGIALTQGPYTVRINHQTIRIRVPVVTGVLRHYYPDYKDYYYLPEEDEAMHKSIASFVDKSRRIQASAANCYTKKHGRFLPQNAETFTPVFQQNNTDKITWFLYSDAFCKQSDAIKSYADMIFQALLS